MTVRRVAIVGAALSANKGAAAMVETVISRLPERIGPTHFTLLTTYPEQDSGRLDDRSVEVLGMEPLRLLLIETPVASLALVARKMRLSTRWVRTRCCRAMLDSHVVVDVAGISFADGRGLPILVYNTLMTGLSLLLGVPTVKAAQAVGPFGTRLNRVLARIVLSNVATVCARGARTREHLDALGIDNVVDVADLAFSLEESVTVPAEVEKLLPDAGEQFLVVMPSAVVKSIHERAGGNYVEAMAEMVGLLRAATGMPVVIAPHSYRSGHKEGRMNDGPVCRDVVARCRDESVIGLDFDLTAGELRHVIARARVLVTSRFHAMISGLSTATPTVVVGWSHKYKEVLDDFGLARFGCDSTALDDPESVVALVREALDDHGAIVATIEASLPAVRERSLANFTVIERVLADHPR